jgi:hypothetical protein
MKYLWDEKGRALREAVNRAHEIYTRASETSKSLLTSGPINADMAQRIADAAKEEHQTLEDYTKTLRAFNDYANRRPS